MDPLSVGSGICGIAAFVFQLAKTASKVKKAVEEVKSAPKEARKLIERLVVLGTACQLVGFHLERRETLPTHPLPPSVDIISTALTECLAKVQGLEQMLRTLSTSDALTGTPRSKLNTLSCLRLVLRKDQISGLVSDIDSVISLLQFVIQVDMWTMTSTLLKSPSAFSNELELMNKSPKPELASDTMLPNPAFSESTVTRNIRRPTTEKFRTVRYLGYITWSVADGRIKEEDDDVNNAVHRKGCITVRLPFTAIELNMHYDEGMGAPSYALNVTHIIDDSSELGHQVHRLMLPGEIPEVLHELVTSRKLSIYSVVRHRDREVNLFFMAVASRWAAGCRYLLQHDFRHQFREAETPRFIFATERPLSGKACEVTEMLLSVRPHDMREKDIKYLMETSYNPEYLRRYLATFLKSPVTNDHGVLSCAWKQLIRSICISDTSPEWIRGLRYLIEYGIDMHQPCYTYHSAYLMMLGATDHQLQAEDRVCSWLQMLKACGVDLKTYIEAETALIDKFGIGQHANSRKRKVVFLEFDGIPMPSWRWESPTQSSIIEVLEEFLHIGSDYMENRLRDIYPAGPDDFKAWTAKNPAIADWTKSCFPFLLSPIDCILEMNDWRLGAPGCRETYKRAVEIRDKRIARRQAKKWKKAHPGEKRPSNKMPGTWVD